MRKTQHGFTLPELLTAMAILAVLAALTIPTLRQFSASSRTTAANNSLISALATARSEAVRRSLPVTVCASDDAKTCGNNWGNGWIVFTDGSGTTGQLDPADFLLQAWGPPSGNVSIVSSTPFFQYDARGMAKQLPDYTFPVTFDTWVPGCKGNNQTHIALTVGGSPQNTHVACP